MRRVVANTCSSFNRSDHRSALSADGLTPCLPSGVHCGATLFGFDHAPIRRLQQLVGSLFGLGDPQGLEIGVGLRNQVVV